MTNLLIPFECPICGADGFRPVTVKGRDGTLHRDGVMRLSGTRFGLRWAW